MTSRSQRSERKYVHFTERDGLIVQAVFLARYLTNRQIGRLFFPNEESSACRTRTRYLFDKGYLKKRPSPINEPDVFYLGLRGRKHVSQTLNCPQDYVDRVAGVAGEARAVSHDLAVSDLYVSLVLQCRERHWTLKWQNARMLELRGWPVQPDGRFRIEELNKEAFIEYTDALPSKKQMDGKLKGYAELFGDDPVPILWFFSSKTKLHQLHRYVKGWPYEDWVLMGLVEEDFLTRPVWKWVGSKELVVFVARHEIIKAEGRPVTPTSGSC